ncbi:hypothetical protein Dalk_4779 [Desulfatibacillum aliphaticivorans]|uniref:Uncharacterized protein n=1 Tax=Desulfatibacillum aliphaticivorans TaxID=218208 RepID=B8FD26_DESAL|nr:hypothetical protein [Desulfatibacillum aliphaticivorans]ACL06457.1 hypothetical protein Dalk_4779 [Desulfatibacillum aliphaticivorans]
MKARPTKAVIGFLEHRNTFLMSDAVKATGLDRRLVLRVLEKLRKEGYLEIIEDRREHGIFTEMGPARRNPRYKKVRDLSLRRSNRPLCEQDKIWRTLRMVRQATRSKIVMLSGCHPSTVEKYTQALEKEGVIRAIGRDGREKVFLVIKDNGPRHPVIPERRA